MDSLQFIVEVTIIITATLPFTQTKVFIYLVNKSWRKALGLSVEFATY